MLMYCSQLSHLFVFELLMCPTSRVYLPPTTQYDMYSLSRVGAPHGMHMDTLVFGQYIVWAQ